MKEFVIRINLHHLKNETHVQFHESVNGVFTKYSPEGTIGPLYTPYKAALDREILALDFIRKSEYTMPIFEQDGLRDGIYRGFTDTVKGACNHFDPMSREAATRLSDLFKHYGNIAKKTLDDETAAINDLLRELQTPQYDNALMILGLHQWRDKLREENDRFVQLMTERYDETAQKTPLRMRNTRVDTDRYYHAIVNQIENICLGGTIDLSNLLRDWNAVIERFRDILAQETGRRHPVKDLGAGDHCVIEPIDTQKYTEKPVIPIPKAYWREDGKPTVELVFAKDFSVTYKNNVNVGTAEVTLHGTGDYKGQKTVTFNIAR